jgi:hypothetical protein
MSVHVRWDKGGEAHIVEVDDGAIVLRSTVPAPPGSRLEGVLGGDPPERLRVKVHSSKRQEDGGFVLAGRLIDATREVRERVTQMAKDAPA